MWLACLLTPAYFESRGVGVPVGTVIAVLGAASLPPSSAPQAVSDGILGFTATAVGGYLGNLAGSCTNLTASHAQETMPGLAPGALVDMAPAHPLPPAPPEGPAESNITSLIYAFIIWLPLAVHSVAVAQQTLSGNLGQLGWLHGALQAFRSETADQQLPGPGP